MIAQKYSAQDTCASTSVRPVAKAAKSRTASSKDELAGVPFQRLDPGRKALFSVIFKIKQWNARAIRNLSTERWLTDDQKKEVLQQIREHDADVQWYADHCKIKAEYELDLCAISRDLSKKSEDLINGVIDSVYQIQSHLNMIMRWWELPQYPLPESVKSKCRDPYQQLNFTALGDAMMPQIPKGASFSATRIERQKWIGAHGVVAVIYHGSINRSTSRQQLVGRLAHIDNDRLYLIQDNSKEDYASIPLHLVSFIYEAKDVTITLPIS